MAKIYTSFYESNLNRFIDLQNKLTCLNSYYDCPIADDDYFEEFLRSLDRSMHELIGDLLHHKYNKIFEYVKKEETKENQS